MAPSPDRARYRRLFAVLVRFYPRRHRSRFEEGMKQTFGDLIRDQVAQGKGCLALSLRLYAGTAVSIAQAHWEQTMHDRLFRRPAAMTALILSIPLVMSFLDRHEPPGEGWHWGPGDFLVMGGLLLAAGLTYESLAAKLPGFGRRAALAGAVTIATLAVWFELAVDGVSQLIALI